MVEKRSTDKGPSLSERGAVRMAFGWRYSPQKGAPFPPSLPRPSSFLQRFAPVPLPSLLSVDKRYVVLVHCRLRASRGGMLRISVVDNTPTSQKQPELDAPVSATYYSACRGEGVDGNPENGRRAASHAVRGQGPRAAFIEDVNAGSMFRDLDYLCDIATVGISNGTPRAV